MTLQKLSKKTETYDTSMMKTHPRFKISAKDDELPKVIHTKDNRDAGKILGFPVNKKGKSEEDLHTYWPNKTSWDFLIDKFSDDEKAWGDKTIELVTVNQMVGEEMKTVGYVKGSFKEEESS